MVIAGGASSRISSSTSRWRGFNGAGDGDRRRGWRPREASGRVRRASTEPAMVIAGGLPGRGIPPRPSTASTEPAMVIAGGGRRARCRVEARGGFNGAGDGDRRRERDVAHDARVLPAASTEPAMVIAGGAHHAARDALGRPASTEPAMVIAGGLREARRRDTRPWRFNGAGDGDRRRESAAEPPPRAPRVLQRSRRW